MMDEIWVPCDWNVEVLKESGVQKPVRKIEHAINLSQFEDIPTLDLGVPKDKFVFYSIFQWTERKNPVGLIKAFLSEFGKEDNVCLVIKSYISNVFKRKEEDLEKQLTSISSGMHVSSNNTAPIYLIQRMLSRQQILSLHTQGDCFVLPARSEGFGIPFLEAMAVGNPTIGTRYGGNTEFMNDENSYLLDYTLTPVAFMPWPIYNGKADWAEPDIGQLRSHMRHVYENQDEAKKKGQLGKETAKNYSWEKIGQKMIDALEE
jgi:glycosyltransferase involved in cell wall biosynthesis